MTDERVALGEVEAWFVETGVPYFAADLAPSRAVLRRAAPVLIAYLALTILLAASFAWSFEVNVLVILAAALLVALGWALVNVLRGRSWHSLPARFGPLEVAAFLIIPAVPPLLIGGQVSDAMIAVAESAVFLGLVYLATSFGLIGALRWAFRRTRAQTGNLGRLLTRALPLLMVFITFAFLQSDTWRLAGALDIGSVLLIVAFFFGLSILFLVSRLVPEIRRLAGADKPWPETLAAARATPAAGLSQEVADAEPVDFPLRWREWVNVGLLVLFGQGIQIAMVTLAVQVVLIAFGLLLVPTTLQAEWSGETLATLISLRVGGNVLMVTDQLLDVALILGAFSGLYFTVSALSDEAYRAAFFSDADRELERVFAARAVYLVAVRRSATAEMSVVVTESVVP